MDHETRMYIDGQWCQAQGRGVLSIINPATESPCAEVAYGGPEDARRAVDAAARALPAWSSKTAYERAEILRRTADLIRQRADTIARLMTTEQGKPLAESKGETLATAAFFEWYGEEAKRLYDALNGARKARTILALQCEAYCLAGDEPLPECHGKLFDVCNIAEGMGWTRCPEVSDRSDVEDA